MTPHLSKTLFARSTRVLPGGVNSPVRAFGTVGGNPPFIAEGHGSKIRDADGIEYIDLVSSWGPLILGHAHPRVVAAVGQAAANSTSFGAPTEAEVELAEQVVTTVPSVEMLRLVNSGTEATMSAIRLARAATGRDLVLKFDGGYHGHADGLLVRAGSGPTTLGLPDSAGVPHSVAALTISIPYNNPASVEQAFNTFGNQLAAAIVEPVAGNMGVVPPKRDFLACLRRLTARHGALLIFDEVITGFRIALGGAQEFYETLPDITCLGKILGGGLPIGAYGASRELMGHVAPLGPMYQAGTLSGNPVAVAAGLATLNELSQNPPYPRLEQLSEQLADGLSNAAAAAGLETCMNRVGSMLTLFFTPHPVDDHVGAQSASTSMFARFHRAMLQRQIYLPPSPFEAMMVSAAHTEHDIHQIVQAACEAAHDLSNHT